MENQNALNLERLSQWFKAIIGLSTLLYITGYLAWVFYAYENNIGFLPTIKEQYLMAGIIPVSMMFIVLAILYNHFKFQDYIIATINNKPKLKACLIVISLIILSVFGIYSFRYFKNYPKWWGTDFYPFLSILGSYLLFISNDGFSGLKGSRTYAIFLFIMLWTTMFFTYTGNIFPSLPYEFGGPKPLKVVLDINRKNLSNATLKLLCNNSFLNKFEYSKFLEYAEKDSMMIHNLDFKIENDAADDFFRTEPVYLIFETDDFILFKKRNDYPICKANPVFKMKSGLISNIISISDIEPYNTRIDSIMDILNTAIIKEKLKQKEATQSIASPANTKH